MIWANNSNDHGIILIEATGDLFLQLRELFRQLAHASERFAHLRESADDKHSHLGGTLAVENICCLKRAVLGKGPQAIFSMLCASLL